jgi:hypothetical protein
MVRNGKIARLPRPLRDELNQRLARNEDGATLLDWLNAAPGVKDLLARDFAGEPVGQQNLHEWRQGGFVEWQSRQDLLAEAADLSDANGEWDALAANDFTERLAAVVVVRYADALAGWKGGDDEAFRLKLRDLRRFNQDLAVLRRYNQTAARLKMEQMLFYREEQQRAEAAASARRQSEAGARAYDERAAQRRRETEAAQMLASATPAPAVIAEASLGRAADRTAPAGIPPSAQPQFGSNQVKQMASEFRASCDRSPATDSPVSGLGPVTVAPAPAAAQPSAAMAASLIRVNLVIKFADSLRQASKVIETRSSHALNLKDRRAVQEAYAGSVATVIRLGREAGCLRSKLPGFAGVDRVSTAIEVLQREYLSLKSKLFQGFPSALTTGIQQLRDTAYELSESLQQQPAPGALLPGQAA